MSLNQWNQKAAQKKLEEQKKRKEKSLNDWIQKCTYFAIWREKLPAPKVNLHAPEVSLRMRSGVSRAIFLIKSQFAVLDTIHFFDADENEFRVAGNVKRIETSAQITSMKSKSSAAEAIGRRKKEEKKEERIERKGRKWRLSTERGRRAPLWFMVHLTFPRCAHDNLVRS